MKNIKKPVLFGLGFVTLGLGTLGIFLPLLPTTVFYLITAACWMRSSERFYTWLMNNRLIGNYIRNYREKKGITLRQKILTISLLWVGIGYTAFFVVSKTWITVLLLAIALAVSIHLLILRTLSREES